MPVKNPGQLVYVTNSGSAVTHGRPVLQSNMVGIAIKQKQGQTSDGFASQTQIATSEQYGLQRKGEVEIDDPGGVVAGDVLYITSTNVIGAAIGVNEVQRVTVDATAGQFKLTFSAQQTADIAFNALAATVQAALVALSNIAPGDVVVTGGPGNAGGTTPYVVTFGGIYADVNVPQMTAANGTTPLSGGAATATVSTLSGGVAYQRFGRVSGVGAAAGAVPGKILVDLDDKSAVAGSAF